MYILHKCVCVAFENTDTVYNAELQYSHKNNKSNHKIWQTLVLDFVLGSEPLELGFVADFEGLEGSFWLAGLDIAGLLDSF